MWYTPGRGAVHTGFGGTTEAKRPLGKPRPAVLIPRVHGLLGDP
jgi:hypothetical protein